MQEYHWCINIGHVPSGKIRMGSLLVSSTCSLNLQINKKYQLSAQVETHCKPFMQQKNDVCLYTLKSNQC